jgi:uncharacterized protein YndB with AHSA1/START domain
MSTPPRVNARVTRRFSTSPERVFDAWLNAEMISRWMFGPAVRDEEVVHIAVDARVGGSFSFLVRRQGEEIDHIGEYLRPRRLVFTWVIRQDSADSSRVIVDIVPLESGSKLTLTHELHLDWADYVSRTEAAWTKMLDMLAETLNSSSGRANLYAS